jgi:DNA-binding LacI/PurR family transcriptional regulator
MTIRKAIETLVAEGLLYKIPTKGAYVSDRDSVKQETKVIGYFLDSSIVAGLTSPYYSMIFNALEKQASNLGYSLIYFSDIGDSSSLKHMNKIDGVIVSCFPRNESLIHDLNKFVPVVTIDNASADKSIPSVIIDNFNATSNAVDHLCQLGHRRIGFMTGLEDSDVGKNRYMGFVHGLTTHGLKVDEELIFRGNYSFESGAQGADYFLSLDETPTAILCANDSMALAAIRKIIQSGLNIPEDISVTGFDDIQVASQINPPLTTIAAPVEATAQHALHMLHSLIKKKKIENMHVALKAKLVARKTTSEARNNNAK